VTHADTSYLVDLMREAARGEKGPARRFLDSLGEETLFVSVHAVCELFAGAEVSGAPASERRKLEPLLAQVDVVYPQDGFAQVYGRLFRSLTHAGKRIPAMDLLIATAAILADARIVTRDERDFSRVPGLKVIDY
jgi:tRNA(fMet)-specific endonuclease VapC